MLLGIALGLGLLGVVACVVLAILDDRPELEDFYPPM